MARRIGLIVFSRLDSRRLPGKALRDLGGRPLLGRVLDRVRLSTSVRDVVVATTDRAVDDPIVDFVAGEKVSAYRGATDDVATRCLCCADEFGFDGIVRISGDSPFMDPQLIDDFVRAWSNEDVDLVTNVFPRTYPPGLSVEVFGRDALRKVMAETADVSDREHVTRYFYRQSQRFRINNRVADQPTRTEPSLAVDTEADLERAIWIVGRLGERPERADCRTILATARQWTSGCAP